MGQKVSKDTFIKLQQIQKELGTRAALDALNDGFKYGDITVIVKKGNDDIEDVRMHWEFIPPWVNNWTEMALHRKGIDPKTGLKKAAIPWFNARGETLLTGRMFADAARKRRCLIPVTNFWEWRSFIAPGAKKEIAYPYSIAIKNAEYCLMAGIWQTWKHNEIDTETGELITEFTNTCAIVTTQANQLLSQIHNKKNRMPVIFTEDLAHEWLFGNLSDLRISELATFQFPSELMEAHTVPKNFKLLEDPTIFHEYTELPEISLT